jgi:hypothetical protein
MVPAGRLLSRDGDRLFGFGRDFRPSGNAGQWNTGEKYVLFSTSVNPEALPPEEVAEAAKDQRRSPAPTKRTYAYEWSKEPGLEVRALVKTQDNLFTAGPLGNTTHSIVAYQGGEGSVIRVFSPDDGSVKADLKLEAPPIFDGMAAADGKLLVVLEDGSVKCLAP